MKFLSYMLMITLVFWSCDAAQQLEVNATMEAVNCTLHDMYYQSSECIPTKLGFDEDFNGMSLFFFIIVGLITACIICLCVLEYYISCLSPHSIVIEETRPLKGYVKIPQSRDYIAQIGLQQIVIPMM
ncbi:unnamed protein product [Diamesa serratosioi]